MKKIIFFSLLVCNTILYSQHYNQLLHKIDSVKKVAGTYALQGFEYGDYVFDYTLNEEDEMKLITDKEWQIFGEEDTLLYAQNIEKIEKQKPLLVVTLVKIS